MVRLLELPRLAPALLAALLMLAIPAWSKASAADCDGRHATIVGTPGNDVIVGKKASDVIYGGGGDDRIYGGPNGNDRICGGPGDDKIVGGRGGDKLFGERGDDTLIGGRGPDRLAGGAEADVLYAGKASDRKVDGGGGDDRVYGGRGNDRLDGGEGADRIDGGLGDDTLNGEGGTDLLIGSHGRDDLFGDGGDEDVLRGDIGFDHLDGGPGERDIADFSTASTAVTVDLATGTAHGDGRDTISGETEDVVGSAYDDALTGDGGANRLDGGGGFDTLQGDGGEDELFGGPGGASCSGAAEAEDCEPAKTGAPGPQVSRVRSIDGSSSLSVRGTAADDSISIELREGRYVISDAGNPIPAANVEECDAVSDNAICDADVQTILIDAGAGDDLVAVDAGVPPQVEVRIEGGPGADQLRGGPGGDVIEAGDDSDPDVLEGGPGDDALIGARTDFHVPVDSGKSTLIGGPGGDVLVGGDPCDGDVFDGGPGNDDANFFRFTPGVTAEIGGPVSRAGGPCTPGHIDSSVEQLEGSPGPDTLIGSHRDDLIGHGGRNRLRFRPR